MISSSCFFSAVEMMIIGFVVAAPIYLFFCIMKQTCCRNHKVQSSSSSSSSSCYLLEEETKNSKPQTLFKCVLADNSYNYFQHLNRRRNIVGSNGFFLSNLFYKTIQFIFNYDISNKNQQVLNQQTHPFQEEIECFLRNGEKIQEFSFVNEGEIDMEMKGSHVWVDKENQLKELVEVLSKEQVFAVDTEQHSYRSFLGFTALMQISTGSVDYLVDTITLHDVMAILRPAFSNPKICKVFHGADSDVVWLQRDFHIYTVNIFDTAKACDVLLKPHKSLEYLLRTYCGVATNKNLQLSDWRLRPLSEEMIQYARMDSHYLLHIADCLARELTHQNLGFLDDKFKSIRSCTKLYKKEIEDFPGNSAVSSIWSRNSNGQSGVPLNSKMKDFVQRLCMWRDLMARVHDESLRYVLSDQAIVALAVKAPTIKTEIYSTICKADLNLDSPSLIVCTHLEDICDLLAEKVYNFTDLLNTSIQKSLGPGGSCPHSIYNDALLTTSKLEMNPDICGKLNKVKDFKRCHEKLLQKLAWKSPVYQDGCKIYRSDGELLNCCTRKERNWYLRQNLAQVVGNDPSDIILLSEPKIHLDIKNEGGKTTCVCCGKKTYNLRHRIIPTCYRQHLPDQCTNSDDVILLCFNCQEIAHSAAEKYKKEIAEEFKIPLLVTNVNDLEENEIKTSFRGSAVKARVTPSEFRKAAVALLRNDSKMPSKRREELKETVTIFLGEGKTSKEDLEKAFLVSMGSPQPFSDWKATITDIKKDNALENNKYFPSQKITGGTKRKRRRRKRQFSLGHGPHGKEVVACILKEKGEDGIREFCMRWRRIFVDSLDPRYLPSGWESGEARM